MRAVTARVLVFSLRREFRPRKRKNAHSGRTGRQEKNCAFYLNRLPQPTLPRNVPFNFTFFAPFPPRVRRRRLTAKKKKRANGNVVKLPTKNKNTALPSCFFSVCLVNVPLSSEFSSLESCESARLGKTKKDLKKASKARRYSDNKATLII